MFDWSHLWRYDRSMDVNAFTDPPAQIWLYYTASVHSHTDGNKDSSLGGIFADMSTTDEYISKTLRSLVVIGTILMVLGLVLGRSVPLSQKCQTLPDILRSAFELKPIGILGLGVALVTIAPLGGLTAAIVGFIKERQTLYAILALGLIIGIILTAVIG